MLSHEKIPGSVVLKKLWKSGFCGGPRTKISRRGGGSFPIAVYGGSPDFYWNSPKLQSKQIPRFVFARTVVDMTGVLYWSAYNHAHCIIGRHTYGYGRSGNIREGLIFARGTNSRI